MGLDQTLFRTTRKCREAKEAFAKLKAEYYRRVEELAASDRWRPFMESLPKDRFGGFDPGRCSPEQRRRVGVWRRELRRIAKAVGIGLDEHRRPRMDAKAYGLGDEDLDEPIWDWRKNWDLHMFIRENFLGEGEGDNLAAVYLTREDCERIVAAGFPEGFREALDRWDDGHEVFYWAWY